MESIRNIEGSNSEQKRTREEGKRKKEERKEREKGNGKEEKKYTIEDYKNLHDNVLKYKETKDEKYSEYIIESFAAFITSYVSLIKRQTCNIENYSIRSFMKLFSNPKEIKVINSYKYKNAKNLNYVIFDIKNKIDTLFETFSEEDVVNELISTLLEMACEYKDTRPSFHTYVKKCFHFYAFRKLTKFTKDSSLKALSLDSDDTFYKNCRYDCESYDEISDYALRTSYNEASSKRYSVYDDRYLLDINWINGYTAHSPFSVLTPFERKIIIMRYVEGYNDLQIADKFGISRVTVSTKRTKAKKKMYQYLVDNKIIKKKEGI